MWWVIVGAAGLIGCAQSTQPESTAERLTLQQLQTTPGFAWFSAEFQAYQPDTLLVAEIRQLYRPGFHRFYIYVKPTCSCVGTQKLFPHFVRVLVECGVEAGDYEIYAMHDVGDRHPYGHRWRLQRLPSFFVTAADSLVGSLVGDLPPDKTIEGFLLEALRR